jgi:hypothetical protein
MRHTQRLALTILALAPLASAAEDGGSGLPSCVPPTSALENPGFRNDTWLAKDGGDAVRTYLSKVMDSQDWRGAELYRGCVQWKQGCMVARLEGAGAPGAAAQPASARRASYFQDLAARSGHSKQEADVLASRYATLAGAFYRQVPDGKGGWESEEAAIVRKHRHQLGIDDARAGGPGLATQAGSEQRGRDLQARAKEAKKRGDMAEMMRIAAEAQGQGVPSAERTSAADPVDKKKAWLLMESSFTELATAAYRSRIFLGTGTCICAPRCGMPSAVGGG